MEGIVLLTETVFKCRTDERGSFRFPHVLPGTDLWAFVKLGSLENQGAVVPLRLRTQEEGSSLDLGVLEVKKGRKLAGRLICSDGLVLPPDINLIATTPGPSSGILRAVPDKRGRFAFIGLPDGPVKVYLGDWPETQMRPRTISLPGTFVLIPSGPLVSRDRSTATSPT